MATLTDFLRGGAQALTAGAMGAPVDTATNLTNLGIAGGGWLAHQLGLVDQPPGLIDPANVPFSSEWLTKGSPLEGSGPAYQAGQLASALVPLGAARVGQVAREAGGLGELLRGPGPSGSPAMQRGVLYPGGGRDLAVYHTTTLGDNSTLLPQELRNLSLMITDVGGRIPGTFGPNILVPRPQKFEPRESPSVIKGDDFYSPRRETSFEAPYTKDFLTALAKDPGLEAEHSQTMIDLVNQGVPMGKVSKLATKLTEAKIQQLRVAGRLRDKDLGSFLPGAGAQAEGVTGGPALERYAEYLQKQYGNGRGRYEDLPLTDEGMASWRAPKFGSFEQYAKSPEGAGRLYSRQLEAGGGVSPAAADLTDVIKQLRREGYELPTDLRKYSALRNADTVQARVELDGSPISREEAQHVAEMLRPAYRAEFERTPVKYGEVKRFGNTGLNEDNFTGMIGQFDTGNTGGTINDSISNQLANRRIPQFMIPTNVDTHGHDVFRLIEELNTAGLRGQKNVFDTFQHPWRVR